MKDRAKRDRQRIADLEKENLELHQECADRRAASQKIYELLYWPESPRDLETLVTIQNLPGIDHIQWNRMCQTHEGAAPSIAELGVSTPQPYIEIPDGWQVVYNPESLEYIKSPIAFAAMKAGEVLCMDVDRQLVEDIAKECEASVFPMAIYRQRSDKLNDTLMPINATVGPRED